MAVADVHPSAEELAAFTAGTLGEDAYALLEAHLAACTSCQERAAVAPGDTLIDLLRRARARTDRQADTAADTVAQVQTPEPLATAAELVTIAPAAAGESDRPEPPCAAPPELAGHERYRVVRLLGEGGMGAVYEAEHRVMQRPVALKVINRAYTANAATVERFRREVRAAARLSHPNVVTTYDAEDAGDAHFLVMEYVEGVSLARLVKERGPLPVAEACDYVRQAALGLQHAHERGMVHRDVKPDNLMLVASPVASAPGVVKVLDFGLAALTAERGDGLTSANVVMGTPDYMAPEQAEDPRAADIRADVYSLGCTLYYLLTGSVPYPAPTSLLKILAHREQPLPNLRQVCPAVPQELARVVARMLAKKPEQRYQTPGEVAAALDPFASDRETSGQGDKGTRNKLGWLVAAAVLFCGILVAGVVVYRVQTDKGELVITTESDDVEVVVKQGGAFVRIIDTKTDKSITLRSGVYELELQGAPEGLKIDIEKATLTRGKTTLAKIERVAKPRAALPFPQQPGENIAPLHRIRFAEGQRFGTVDVSQDGRYFLASRLGVNRTRVYEMQTGKLVREVVGSVARFTTNGEQVIATDWSEFRVFDLTNGKVVRRFESSVQSWNFHLSTTGTRLLNVSPEGAQVWDWSTGKKLSHIPWTLQDHTVLTPDGRYLLQMAGGKPPLRAFDAETGKPIEAYRQLRDVPDLGQISADHKRFLCLDGHVWKVYDVRTGKEIKAIDSGSAESGSLNGDGRLLLAYSLGSTAVGIWEVDNGRRVATLRFPESLDGTHFVSQTTHAWYAVFPVRDSIYVFHLPDLPAAKDKP